MRHIKSVILKRLKTLNNKTLKNAGIIDANIVCKKLKEIIKQKSTEEIEVLFCKKEEACIKCLNSFLANELYLNQEEIKDEVNKFFNKEVLKKIIFKA